MIEYFELEKAVLDDLALLKIRLVGLAADAAGKYPSQLSGGMIVPPPSRARWHSIPPCCFSMSPPPGSIR